jgi:membrane-associated protease RseP (regulator of RpoE activity)
MKALFSISACLCILGVAAPAWSAPGRRSNKKAYLGVALATLTKMDRRQKKVPRYGGVLIQSVLRSTPAYRAGFRPGDVIMRINNKYVYKPADVMRRVARARVGSRLKIDIIRNGGWMMARVLLTARPRKVPGHVDPRPAPRRVTKPPPAPARRGAVLRQLKALQREVRQLKQMIRNLKLCRRR